MKTNIYIYIYIYVCMYTYMIIFLSFLLRMRKISDIFIEELTPHNSNPIFFFFFRKL